MKKRVMVILIVLHSLLVLALLASPVLAKSPETPEKGLLWETIAGLEQQIEEGLAALGKKLNEGLDALQQQIDGIQAYLDDFEEKDPVFGAMDTEAELETHIGENILTEGEDISLLNNTAGYITEGDIHVSWDDISGIPAGFADGEDDIGITTRIHKRYEYAWEWFYTLETKHLEYTYDMDPGKHVIGASGYVYVNGEGLLDKKHWDIDSYYFTDNVSGDTVTFDCHVHNPWLIPVWTEMYLKFFIPYYTEE